MQDTDSLIAQYYLPGVDKLQLLRWLGLQRDSKAFGFLVDVALAENEADTTRIEALNGIELYKGVGALERTSAGMGLLRILENEQDDLLRNYAAMALRNYIATPQCLQVLEEIVRNPNEELDLRYNAFDAIESNLADAECRLVFSNLLNVPEFQDHVLRRLREPS